MTTKNGFSFIQHWMSLVQCSVFLVSASLHSSAEILLLQNGTVHTVSGETFSPGEVLIDGNSIVSVNKKVSPKGKVTKIDLTGQHVYPGIIALSTTLGLSEIPSVRATRDYSEVGEFTPEVCSWLAVNPDSELLPVARANGIAYFQPVPQGGTVSGQSGLVALSGWTTEDMTRKAPIGLHVFWPEMGLQIRTRERRREVSREREKSIDEQDRERKMKLKQIDDFFDSANAYQKAGTPKKDAFPNPPWEAMQPYVRGQLPIFVHANDLRQIKAAVKWAHERKQKIVLVGGRDAWMVAESLATNQIPVIYEHVWTQPSRSEEPFSAHFEAPAKLQKAGVKIAFSLGLDDFDASLVKNVPYLASRAIAYGLPEEEALKAMTLYPAEIMGMGEKLGSIAPGREATLVIADGNILDIRTHITRMWIAGKEVSLESRHTRLYEKYKNRPKAN
jgi:imidazolonepropionase-like amidohydrolase